MDARPWLEHLRHELARQNLPPLYVERLVEELSDHLTDFMEDRMSTDAKDLRSVADRLGAVRDIAAAAHSEFRKTTFWGRHPLVSFVLLPILALPVVWAASFVVVLLAAKLLGFESGGNPSQALAECVEWAMPGVVFASLFAPVVAVAALVCRLGQRAGVNWKWTVSACSIVAVIGGMAVANIVLPNGATKGAMMFGFSVSQSPGLAQILQFAAPLAIGIWAGWRQSDRNCSALAR